MIYIKRILWLIGVLPVCLLIISWITVELVTAPLRIILHFILKGNFTDFEFEWFRFIVEPLIQYLQIKV